MNGRHNGASASARGLSGLAHDVIALGELQAQLLACDVRDGKTRAVAPMLCLIAGLMLALGTVPVLLLAAGQLLVEHAGWSQSTAFLASGLSGAVVGAGLVWIGWSSFRSAWAVMSRSRHELGQNLQWLKNSLRGRSDKHTEPSS